MASAASLFEEAAKRMQEQIASASADYQRRLDEAYREYAATLSKLMTDGPPDETSPPIKDATK